MDAFATLGGLFLTAFLAATIFPAQSEILLGALHMAGMPAPATLVTVATAGNVLGSVVNWLLGRYLINF
jgi:membrane protein YqaA with SNARE-associated domain